jgi:ketosteroid isomerase-like protein
MAQEDVDRLREGYDNFNKGDLAGFTAYVHDDFVISDRDDLVDPQTYSGMEGAVEAAQGAGEEFDDYRIDPDEFIDLGDAIIVVATQSGTGSASGARVEGPIVHLWRMRDGKATSMKAYSSKEQALAALEEDEKG